MVTRRARILVALDDDASNEQATTPLVAARHDVRTRPTTETLERCVATFQPDLVIIDLTGDDAEQLAFTIRRIHSQRRPLVLCAVDGHPNRVDALRAGADAYVERPFTTDELQLHVRALLNRSPWMTRRVHHVGELVVDEDAHEVTVGDQQVALPIKEFNLLATLAAHAGFVLSKRALLDAVWGFDAYDENLVEVHVSALRRLLPPDGSRLIRTVRGVGYVLRTDLALDRLG